MERRIMGKAEDKRTDTPIEKDEASSTRHISKERPMENQVGSKTNPASGRVECDSSVKYLIKKAKRVHKTSEHPIPSGANNVKAVLSQTSIEDNYREQEPESNGRLDSSEYSRKNVISKRNGRLLRTIIQLQFAQDLVSLFPGL